MICPVEIARDMSALRAVRIGDHAEHGSLSEGRDGAGDESTGCDVAGNGEEDHVVAGGGDPGHSRPAHAALAGALRGRGIQRIAGPAAGQAVAAPGGGGDGGESVRLVPGEVFRYGAGFIIEAADQARIGRSNHLNCNKPANLRIVGFIDYAHSTLPNGPENVVLSDFYHRTGCGASRSTVSVWAKRVYS